MAGVLIPQLNMEQDAFFKGGEEMVKNALPLILTSICLTATPVCAAEKVNAVLPVTCTARESTEKFAVLIEGDSVYEASPSIVYLSDGDNKSFTVSIEMPGDYKYKIYQKKGNNKNTDYDKTIYQAEVFVTEDDDGKLNADTVVFSNGSSEKSAACSFVNKVKSPTPAQDTETQNKTTGKNNTTGKSAAGNPGSSGNVGAVSKSTSSAAEKVRTGVDTFECLYAGIGLAGMITAILALQKRRKTK